MDKINGEEGLTATTIGGDSNHSYKYNSGIQRTALTEVKGVLEQVIMENFHPSSCDGHAITIVDLGCSVGPNTFLFVQTIIDAIQSKISHQKSNLEFLVFFNDLVGNDFNRLFQDLPPNRAYFAASVPGSFYTRLFPCASVHYFNSATAIHLMSKFPRGVVNKGRVHVPGGGPKVLEAYSAQFRADIASFLKARSEELVVGGIMSLGFICRPESVNETSPYFGIDLRIFETILQKLVGEGIVEEEDLDTFQFPLYPPSLPEFRDVLKNQGCFDFVAEHTYQYHKEPPPDVSQEYWSTILLPKVAESFTGFYKAALEGILKSHFGEAIVEEVYKRMPCEISRIFQIDMRGPFVTCPQGAWIVLKKIKRRV